MNSERFFFTVFRAKFWDIDHTESDSFRSLHEWGQLYYIFHLKNWIIKPMLLTQFVMFEKHFAFEFKASDLMEVARWSRGMILA